MNRTLRRCHRGLMTVGVWVCLVAVTLPLVLLSAGCGEQVEQPAFVVLNRSGDPLKHLVITDAGPVLNYPRLGDGDEMTRKVPGDRTLPKIVNVYWEDAEGKSHHQRVELWKRVNSDYNGAVKLTLERTGSIRVSKTSV